MKIKRYQLEQLSKVHPVLTLSEEASLVGGAQDLGNGQVALNYSEMLMIYGNVAYFPEYAFPAGLLESVDDLRYSDGSNEAMNNLLDNETFYLCYSDIMGYEGALGLDDLGGASSSGNSGSSNGSSTNVPFDLDTFVNGIVLHVRSKLYLGLNYTPGHFEDIAIVIRNYYNNPNLLPQYTGILDYVIDADEDHGGCTITLSDYSGNMNNGMVFYYALDHPIYYGGKPVA